ncbi:L,D-transpeptidase [Clostridium uliginosum]|uniref:L,D-transpeptidase catalytic domain n=1 Tax=Clostridium uliginosum TaxID=119641 RepID=A0A1I1L8T6_9CLOT|nr:L,D-transpeptidase [Clostridium uliginosum]SFC69419.1 L,D-transpeptidase catalytic domain [Clostridium uliginosum]
MQTNKHFQFNKKSHKIIIYISLILVVLTSSVLFEAYKYNKFFTEFKTNFENNNFSQANKLLLTKENFNPFKDIMFKKDLSNYFIDNINNLKQNIDDKTLTQEEILSKIKEIDRYSLTPNEMSTLINNIPFLEDSINNYTNGIDCLNKNQYLEAMSYFNNVSPLDPNYIDSLICIRESKNKIKEDLFVNCDNLANSDYYKQALNSLYDSADIIGEDKDINKKISEIKVKQQEYLDKNSDTSQAMSETSLNNLSNYNINTLNLKSNTSYLINISIKNQKTYIYKGNSNNWSLDKTFSCSTGINGEDTPCGSFTIKEKGAWFFSEKYNQGGKYWTQIDGDILFHSMPFDKDKTTILDTTLNKRSSHGCIRLSLNDAKWIYDNIPRDTKIIIK